MADPTPAPAPETPAQAPVSPTGTPIVPPGAMKVVVPIVTLAGGLALAPSMGVDVSFLPAIVVKVCALVAFLGMVVGIAGPGVRK